MADFWPKNGQFFFRRKRNKAFKNAQIWLKISILVAHYVFFEKEWTICKSDLPPPNHVSQRDINKAKQELQEEYKQLELDNLNH